MATSGLDMLAPKPSSHLERLRFTGIAGRRIPIHRALRTIEWHHARWLHPLVLTSLFLALLIIATDPVMQIWQVALQRLFDIAGLESTFTSQHYHSRIGLSFAVPHPDLGGNTPTVMALWIVAIFSSTTFIWSHFANAQRLPLHYVICALSGTGLLSVAWFAWSPIPFPHTIGSHVRTGFTISWILALVTPLLLSLSFYPFDHSLPHKCFGTLMIVATLVLFAPLQYTSHAILLHWGTLVLAPLLFIFFGFLPNAIIFIALYAWLMSSDRSQ